MKKVLILGASGLVGSALLKLLLQDESVEQVIALVRKPLPVQAAKLTQLQVDFDQLSQEATLFKDVEDVFCCLGTTMRTAGSKEAFQRVDLEYPLVAARLAMEGGARRYFVITALGANPTSRVYYSRIKGELEEKLMKMGFAELHIFRPSLLLGERTEKRPIESLSAKLTTALPFLWKGPLRAYKPIMADTVAAGMLLAAKGKSLLPPVHSSHSGSTFIYPSEGIERMVQENR